MKKKAHIIEKVVVDVNTTKVQTANLIKNNINLFLKNEVFPNLEKLLAKYEQPNLVMRLNSLKIDLNVSNWEDLNMVKFEIVSQIEKHLQNQIEKDGIVTLSDNEWYESDSEVPIHLSPEVNNEEVFLYFLQFGFLPWYGKKHQIVEFQKENNWKRSFKKQEYINKIIWLLYRSNPVFIRFIYQSSAELVATFISKINPRLAGMEKKLVNTLNHLNKKIEIDFLHTLFIASVEKKQDKVISKFKYWLNYLEINQDSLAESGDGSLPDISRWVLRSVSEDLIADENFHKILDANLYLISENSFPEMPETKISIEVNGENPESPWSEKEHADKDFESEFFDQKVKEVAIQNAGIILLHPFLKYFFAVLRITNSMGIIKPSKKDLAVQVLHFLSTGSEEFFEANLVFEKFLCGMPLRMPVPKESLLTEEIKKEAEKLLSEVVKNWPELKNTSIDGLRQMFLQRDGKLIQKNKKFKLIIERKAQDILLEKLNWNISLIKLKWLSELLFVDW